ncbi:hypothetical protein QPK87_23210 [Kamptonema cortianum]|nr:hypothetical protein [Kamptonema cortianum]MDL5044535.1 hypothetical protein [Oscillatoria amoena NRMC-F 0135]
MEFDWRIETALFPGVERQDVEESFEDPFSLRFLPESQSEKVAARYFNLGQSGSGTMIFSVYRSNGKSVQIVSSRPMVAHEEAFYHRRMKQSLDGEARL